MKKVNKTILLASTLFVASTLIGNTNAYADEDNNVDLTNEQASDSKDIEGLEDSSIDANDESEIQTEKEPTSLENESDSEEKSLPEVENSVDNTGDTEKIKRIEKMKRKLMKITTSLLGKLLDQTPTTKIITDITQKDLAQSKARTIILTTKEFSKRTRKS